MLTSEIERMYKMEQLIFINLTVLLPILIKIMLARQIESLFHK